MLFLHRHGFVDDGCWGHQNVSYSCEWLVMLTGQLLTSSRYYLNHFLSDLLNYALWSLSAVRELSLS